MIRLKKLAVIHPQNRQSRKLIAVTVAMLLTTVCASAQVLISQGLPPNGKPQHCNHLRSEFSASLFATLAQPTSPKPVLQPAEIDHWFGLPRTLLRGSSDWRYLETKNGPTTGDWIQPDFDDSQWKKGTAPLGYGEPGIATALEFGENNNKHPAAYFRLPFKINKASEATWALRTLVDDGAVFYLNGSEIQRVRMPRGRIRHTTRPTEKAGASSGLENRFTTFEIDQNILLDGNNVLCVSVHQSDADSSDLVLDLELIGLSPSKFATLLKHEKQKATQLADAEKLAAPPEKIPVARLHPASALTAFDSRIAPERTLLEHMVRSLPTMMDLSKDQVEELVLAVADAYGRLRESVDRRSEMGDQASQNRIRTEIYQGKISLAADGELAETFTAILTPSQLNAYSQIVASREEARMRTTLEMFYANLNCGLFFSDEQRPQILKLLRGIAEDPANAHAYGSNSNPVSSYYKIQAGFTNAVRKNDSRIAEIFTPRQLTILKSGTSNSIYGGNFIKLDRALAPQEK
ncbi:MAG: hypothetical protein ACI9R3_000128 [Verrucomicrobiales bacterium]|jgi:hypothetical protein